MKTIRIACDVRDAVALDDLVPFQGALKSLAQEDYERLKKEILETGFAFPIHVWTSPEKVQNILGGHQRVFVLKKMREEGYLIPAVPVIRVLADNLKQAKRRVLQDISQYGRVEKKGLFDFMMGDAGLGPGELAADFRLPDINLIDFNAEFFLDSVTGAPPADGMSDHAPGCEPGGSGERGPGEPKTGSTEYGAEDFASFNHKCPRCGFEFDA